MKTVSSNPASKQAALDHLRHRKQAYLDRLNPENPTACVVLTDLARFCRAGKSTFDPDPRVHALLEGRREVWLRIAEHLEMTETELYDLFVRGVK